MNMNDDAIIAISPLLLGYALKSHSRKEKRKGRVRVLPWVKMAEHNGTCNALLNEFSLKDREGYRR